MIAPKTMRTDVLELLNEREAIVSALPPSEREYNEYCDFYKLNLEDGTLSLFAPFDASVGSSVGTDSKYGSGQTRKAVDGELYFTSTTGDYSYLYKLKEGRNHFRPADERERLRQLRHFWRTPGDL